MEGIPTSWRITMSPVNTNLIPHNVRPRNRRLREVLSRVYLQSPNEVTCPCRDCMDKKRRRIQSAKQVSRMLEAQSLYKPSSPQPPTIKRRRLRLSSVPLVDLRSTSLPGTSAECEQVQAQLCSGSEFNRRLLSTSGVWVLSEGMEGASTVRIKHLTNTWEGQSRFPKLDECAHFHYEFVELGSIQVCLCDEPQKSNNISGVGSGSSKSVSTNQTEEECRVETYPVQITSLGKTWIVRRTYDNFCLLDEQLHRCIYDRKFSILPELNKNTLADSPQNLVRNLLSEYLARFSDIAGSLISCGPILNWLELDNRGNRLIVTDDSAINTPAVAAAYVIKRYLAQATDEISFEVGDMISVIDMPPPEESIWWRGKKGFEVGFFPCECVEIIGDKIPQSINIPKAPTKPVLRKHGKLISFFRSFILSRPSRRKLKQSGILKERVFGCDLGEHLLNSQQKLPLVLTSCSQFIEEHGVVDGIYRLSGVTSNIQKLRNSFDEDRVPNLNDSIIVQDIHCVASLLKMYFRELPNPLLTYQLYDKFVSAVQSDESVRLLNMRDVVQQLPPPHYRTLEYLIRHLARVASYGNETGMTPKNIAIVWAPNLLRSKELEIGSVAALQVVGVQAIVTEYLIRYVDLIFNEKLLTFNTNVCTTGTPKKTRPKSLAISTPTKLLSLEEARSRALSSSAQVPQKYIEVGGGPASLPSKYHTVIDLPHRKRESTKLKKSPSGWKSFFSKNKQVVKEKVEIKHQSSIRSDVIPSTSVLDSDKLFSATDSISGYGKPLRSVKSAESLISSHSHHGSDICDLSKRISDSNGASVVSSMATNKASPHTHLRSLSHDSYFDLVADIATDDATENDDECFEERIKRNELETDESDEQKEETSSRENDQREANDVDAKSPKKHRWKQSESMSPRSKLSLKEKLKHAFSSPPAARKMDEESIKYDNSQKLSIVAFKDKLCYALSPDLSQRRVLSGIDNLGIDDDDDDEMEESTTNYAPRITEENDVVEGKVGNSKVTVERYGSEKTVIVEVHATQESEDEENREVNVVESPSSVCEIDSPASVLATISDNETLSVSAFEEMSDDILDTSFAEYTSDPDAMQPDSEISTPKSFIADILDTEAFSALAFGLNCEAKDLRNMDSDENNVDEGKENEDVVNGECESEGEKEEIVEINDEAGKIDVVVDTKGDGVEDKVEGQSVDQDLRSPAVTASSELSTPSPLASGKVVEEAEKVLFGYTVLVDEVESGKSGSEEEQTPNLRSVCDELSDGCQETSPEATTSSITDTVQETSLTVADVVEEMKTSKQKENIPSILNEHVSPMDESRRKIESEIGRDILHERKMKLELEKIQIEQRLNTPSVESKNKVAGKVSSNRPSEDEDSRDVSPGQVNEFELRRGKSDSAEREETKRNSEPIFHTKDSNDSLEFKRYSEPHMRKCEKKTNVKELLSRFEIPSTHKCPPSSKCKATNCSSTPSSPVFTDPTSPDEQKCIFKPPPAPTSQAKSKPSEKSDGNVNIMSTSLIESIKPSVLTEVNESDSARRERIDKYKEERRAQLREKIKSESFRMNKEEKHEYLARLKNKATSPLTTPDGDEIVHYGSLRKTRVSNSNDFPPPSPRRCRASVGEIGVAPSGESVVSPSRVLSLCEGSSYNSYKSKSPSKKSPRALWSDGKDSKTKDDLSCSNIPLLRSVPGRRSLPSANHDDSFIADRQRESPSKSVRRRASALSSGERGFSSRDSTGKEKDIEKSSLMRSSVGSCSSDKRTKGLIPRGESKPKVSPRIDVKSYPVEGALLKLNKKSSSLTSPCKIRDVTAIFEKEASTSSSASKSGPRGGSLSVIATHARYLSQNPEKSSDQSGREVIRGKANQYLSAV